MRGIIAEQETRHTTGDRNRVDAVSAVIASSHDEDRIRVLPERNERGALVRLQVEQPSPVRRQLGPIEVALFACVSCCSSFPSIPIE